MNVETGDSLLRFKTELYRNHELRLKLSELRIPDDFIETCLVLAGQLGLSLCRKQLQNTIF